MSRMLAVLLCVTCSLPACGSGDDKVNNDTVKIVLFQAAPDTIEPGQSTKLVFAVEPADARVAINGVGDVTGKTEAAVSPTTTTSYQLTATSGIATTNKTVVVTVGAAAISALRLEVATATPTAGDPLQVTLTILGKDGKTATGFHGTLALSSSDGHAVLPGDLAFADADAGVKTAMVTLKTAGTVALTATDKSGTIAAQASTTVVVRPGPARAYQLSKLPGAATAGDALVLTITAVDAFGNVATSYDGKVRLVSTDASDVLPPGGGFVAGVANLGLAFTRVGDHVAQVQDTAAVISSATTTSVAIGPARAASFTAAAAAAPVTAGEPQTFTATAFDRFGNVATGYAGTVHFTASDPRAVLPADFAFTAGDAGKHDFAVTLKTAGTATVNLGDLATAEVAGSASWTVVPAAASAFVLSSLPASATAGQALVLSITVQDAFANIVTGFAGQAAVTSGDPTDVLPPVGGFTSGVRTVSIEFTRTGSHAATVTDPASLVAATTTSVAVSAGAAFRVAVATTNTASTAGATESLTTRIVDFFDNTVVGYAGTLHFAATDPRAVVPTDFTFSPIDAGTHDFGVTLKTSGTTTLSISDAAAAGLAGSATWRVGAAGAATCIASQAPATATAGSVLGLTVAVQDAFGNAATDYAGTIALTASDARASLPAAATYGAPDAGRHAFSVALVTAGDQTVTATDVANAAIQCHAVVAIAPGAPRLVLTVPPDANAGFPVSVAVAVKDVFDNPIPTYTGTVTFTSTDTGTGAVTPGPLTFGTGDSGQATTSATFVTLGPQTLAASDGGAPRATGSKAATVHGLVYTQPTAGRIRLVANPASNAQVVQLDLVANERLEVSAFFGGPGSFSAGMNLPLDTTRAGAGSPLFVRGAALPPGPGVPAQMAAIGADHVLYTGVSRKRVTGTAVATQDTDVPAGQVFYSVRLALQATSSVGPVFDGAQPMAMFRAAVRDQFGDDFVGQVDFGVGKLEVR
jgi:hypothetical protein